MNEQQITKYVIDLIRTSLDNQEIENPKVDCKLVWHNLKDERSKQEFFKDISAIANTVGLDGFIVYGYDDKKKEFNPVKFSDCGLRDTSDLYSIVAKHVEGPMDLAHYTVEYEGKYLNVLHIPPSLTKPHVIKRYVTFDKDGKPRQPDQEQKIFVRKGTAIHSANKYDIDFMYYDRKNIIPDHEVFVFCTPLTMDLTVNASEFNDNGAGTIHGHIAMTFENTGRRPIDIGHLTFDLIISEEPSNPYKIRFSSKFLPQGNHTLIRSNDMATLRVPFFSHPDKNLTYQAAIERRKELSKMLKHLIIRNIRLYTTNNFEIVARIK